MRAGNPRRHARAKSAAPAGRRAGPVKTFGILGAFMVAVAGCEMIPQDSPELSLEPIIEAPAPGTIELAELAISEHRFGDAKKLLERVLIAEPDNVRAKLVSAELLLATGSPKHAAAAFGRLVDFPEVSALAVQGQGISLMLTGDKKQGYDSVRKAVEQDPTLWRAWNALGYYYDSNGSWAEAVESYDKALAANPDSALIYNNRGYSMVMQGRLQEAIDDLSRALRIDPDLELAQENLRLAFAWSGKYVHAMSGASQREMGRVLNNVGFIALLRGDYVNAEAYLLRAMEVDPSFNDVASRNLSYLKHLREISKSEAQSAGN